MTDEEEFQEKYWFEIECALEETDCKPWEPPSPWMDVDHIDLSIQPNETKAEAIERIFKCLENRLSLRNERAKKNIP